ncbi:MAG: hypothetical protein M1813_005569 [Trichoglossum hirsutum]|nr:MAG: hypothetical protein M1813_005569 [Trichoglossum hirsutum]
MTVLVLGLTVGLAIKGKNVSAYHSLMVVFLVNVSTYSIVLTHYLLWSAKQYPQRQHTIGSENYWLPSVLELKWQRTIYLAILFASWVTSLVLNLGNNESSLEKEYNCTPFGGNEASADGGIRGFGHDSSISKLLAVITIGVLIVSTIIAEWLRRKVRLTEQLQSGDIPTRLCCCTIKIA